MADYNHPLTEGWNNEGFLGKTRPIENAVASIMDYLVVVWDAGYVNFYEPGNTGSTLHEMAQSGFYMIQVSQDCIWTYPVLNGNGSTPPPGEGFCEIVSVSGIPAQAAQGEEIAISMVVKNTSSSFSQCYGGVDSELAFQMEPPYLGLDAGAEGTIICRATMPNKNVLLYISSGHWDGTQWVVDDRQGPYTITLSGEPPPPPPVKGFPTLLIVGGFILVAIVLTKREE